MFKGEITVYGYSFVQIVLFFIYIVAAFMKNTTFLGKIRPSYILENVFCELIMNIFYFKKHPLINKQNYCKVMIIKMYIA